jgi:DNA replication protein DnaC
VRFYSTVDLVNALEQEKAQGKAGRIANSLLRMDLVILDELGEPPRLSRRLLRLRMEPR